MALETYNKLSYSHQKEYINWILETKREETRQNRKDDPEITGSKLIVLLN